MRPLIYLIGTAGNPHYGDEVITASWLRYYADRFPQAEVWLDTPRPGQTSVLHGDAHPRLRCVDSLFHACWNAPSEVPDECVAFGATVLGEPGRLPREASGLSAALRADVVHVLGGAYINAIWPRHLALLGAATRIGERSGARTAITGADLMPVTTDGRAAVGDVLSRFDLVDVRDGESHAMLAEAVPALTQTGDDAFLDLQRQPIDRRTRARTVVEIQSDLLDVPLENLAAQVVRLLQGWGADQDEVLLLESLPPDDVAVLPLLQPHLPNVTVKPFELLWREGLPLASSQRWVTTRFHSHLMAAAAGAWGVALAGSPTIAGQHRSLIEMGSGWALGASLDQPVPSGHSTRHPFDGRFTEIVAAKRAVADTIAGWVT
jgi:polysaccharide pyruvyl transferase WcaK-like protein